jgi:hypothetical protein
MTLGTGRATFVPTPHPVGAGAILAVIGLVRLNPAKR